MCRYYCSDPNYPVCPLTEAGFKGEAHWRAATEAAEQARKKAASALVAADFDEPPTSPGYVAGQRCAHRWESTLGPVGFSIEWHCAICGAKPVDGTARISP